jgi:hypothetical protein
LKLVSLIPDQKAVQNLGELSEISNVVWLDVSVTIEEYDRGDTNVHHFKLGERQKRKRDVGLPYLLSIPLRGSRENQERRSRPRQHTLC